MNPERGESQADDWPEGRYANYFKVGYNAVEVVLDFGQCYAEDEGPQLHTRIIMTPAYAKSLIETLQESLEQYEQKFG